MTVDKFYYDKLHRKEKVNTSSGSYSFEKEQGFNKYLKSLSEAKNFNPKIFDIGVEFYQSGNKIEDAPEELRNNSSFISGMSHAKRLAMIEEIEKNNGNKR